MNLTFFWLIEVSTEKRTENFWNYALRALMQFSKKKIHFLNHQINDQIQDYFTTLITL